MEKKARIYSVAGAVLAWFAVIAQYIIMLSGSKRGVTLETIQFLSYFTILTNILVAISFSFLALPISGALKRFMLRGSTQSAITVYIAVVGILYSILLRGTWNPQGFQLLTDELLHTVVPLLYIFFWILFTPKQTITLKLVWGWMLYPASYLAITLVRGIYTGYYPYYFLNIEKVGIKSVLITSIGMTLTFAVMSVALVFISRFLIGRK